MKYYLGIDGGGTKTKINIIDENEVIIFENTAGPSSIDTVSIAVTYQNIYEAIKPYLDAHKITFYGIFAGLGGIVFDEDRLNVCSTLKNLPGVTENTQIDVQNDMYNALYSGLLFNEGIALICGTGMVAFGKNVSGQIHKAGGWGYKEGELGSGFHLGKAAISYMIRGFDDRYEKDQFALDVAHFVGLKASSDIIPILDDLYINRTKVASIAPIVIKHAKLGHTYALKILDDAAFELALAVKAVYQNLNLKQTTLVVVGSLGNLESPLKEKLHEYIKQFSSNITIIAPKVDPAYAAALMAMKL